MRVPIIAGNWKMNMSLEEANKLVKGIIYGIRFPGEVDVIVAPPFTMLHSMAELLKNSFIGLSGQNLHWEDKGAFTGEVSASMLKDVGAEYVIIGHSERRQYFGETDETVNKRTKAALKYDLTPIVCVGETLSERESGNFREVIERQVTEGLRNISSDKEVVVAYEPVWAIGTGKTASPEQAEEVHHLIRSTLALIYDKEVSDKIRILYGGSVKPSNAKELLSQSNIDGALVGGASLKAEDFVGIIKGAIV